MKVLLIDDHALFRAGLRMLLTAIAPAAEIFEAGSVEAALALAAGHQDLSVCLLDLTFRDGDGITAIHRIKQTVPGITIIIVSGTIASASVHEAIDAGAMSFISKSDPPEELRKGLHQALAGNVYVPSFALRSLDAGESAQPSLTPRQLDVLQRLCRGLPNKLICDELNLSENTVKEHVTTLFRALGVRNRTQAVLKASQLGLRFR
mgnify:CR=1 FL=1